MTAWAGLTVYQESKKKCIVQLLFTWYVYGLFLINYLPYYCQNNNKMDITLNMNTFTRPITGLESILIFVPIGRVHIQPIQDSTFLDFSWHVTTKTELSSAQLELHIKGEKNQKCDICKIWWMCLHIKRNKANTKAFVCLMPFSSVWIRSKLIKI